MSYKRICDICGTVDTEARPIVWIAIEVRPNKVHGCFEISKKADYCCIQCAEKGEREFYAYYKPLLGS